MKKIIFTSFLLLFLVVIFFNSFKGKEICKEIKLKFNNKPINVAIFTGLVQGRDWHWWYDDAISGNKYGDSKSEKIKTQYFSCQTNNDGLVNVCGLKGVYIASSIWYEDKIYKGYESDLNKFSRIPSVINFSEGNYICPITTVYRRSYRVIDDFLELEWISKIDKKYDVLFYKVKCPDESYPDNVPYEIVDHETKKVFIKYSTNYSGEIYVDVPKGRAYDIKIYPNKTKWPGIGKYSENYIAGKYKQYTIKNVYPSPNKSEPVMKIELEPINQ